jgi:hypothetical protein
MSAAPLEAAAGEGAGIIAGVGGAAVPVPAGAAAGKPVRPGFATLPRIGGGGGPDLPVVGLAGVPATGPGPAGSLESAAALAGLAAGCDGGLGDSVTDDSARDGEYATADGSAGHEHYKEFSDSGYSG